MIYIEFFKLKMNSKKMIPISSKDSESKDGESRALIKVMDRPTFILKTREGESRAVSPSQRNGNKYLRFFLLDYNIQVSDNAYISFTEKNLMDIQIF